MIISELERLTKFLRQQQELVDNITLAIMLAKKPCFSLNEKLNMERAILYDLMTIQRSHQ